MLKFRTLSKTPPSAVYTEPSTGYTVKWDTSIDDLYEKVAESRRAHGIQLTEGWKDEVIHQMCMTLKVDNWDEWCYDTEVPHIPRLAVYGRTMWNELHNRALAYPNNPDEHDRQNARSWFHSWEARIPTAMNCGCAANWKRLALGEPDFSSRRAYYLWTVNAHDRVREHLGQPFMDGEFRRLA